MEREGRARLERQRQALLETLGEDHPAEEANMHLEMYPTMYPELRIGIAMVLGEQYLQSGSENLERHRYEEAERYLKLALAIFRDIGAYSEEVAVSNDLGVYIWNLVTLTRHYNGSFTPDNWLTKWAT